MAELLDVLSREKFKEIRRAEINSFVSTLGSKFVLLDKVSHKLNLVEEDSDDNLILNAAVDGKADYIVTGDRHLLGIRAVQRVKIIGVGEMVSLLELLTQ